MRFPWGKSAGAPQAGAWGSGTLSESTGAMDWARRQVHRRATGVHKAEIQAGRGGKPSSTLRLYASEHLFTFLPGTTAEGWQVPGEVFRASDLKVVEGLRSLSTCTGASASEPTAMPQH